MTNHHNQTDIQKQLHLMLPSPLQELKLSSEGPTLSVKRDDLIHPIISGNKWRKLQAIIRQFDVKQFDGIVSFGGGYSNHLHALGYVCQQLQIPFTACIRGDYSKNLTPMLQDLTEWQCDLRWLTKVQYKRKAEPEFIAAHFPQLHSLLVIPEGGSSQQAIDGMRCLVTELPDNIDIILCPVASGGTMAGIIQALAELKRNVKVIGIAVLKGRGYLEQLVANIVTRTKYLHSVDWQIMHDFHGGGYAKAPPELAEFCHSFSATTGIPVEPVYSGKLFFALTQLLNHNFFPADANICVLHTGGLQGARDKCNDGNLIPGQFSPGFNSRII